MTLAQLPPSLVGMEARVAELAIYPVKGLGALRVSRARVDRHGLVDPGTGLADRGVMLAYKRAGISAEGERFDAVALANRNEATLALAKASLVEGDLVYEAPSLPPLRLTPASLAPRPGGTIRVKLPYDGGPVLEGVLDAGPLAAWIQGLLRAHPATRRFAPEDVVAVHPPLDLGRPVAEKHRAGEDAQTLYGDGAHALVASTSTLDWMNRSLAQSGERTIAMAAFRPNVVLEGFPPNAEDVIRDAEIVTPGGPVRVVFATMCVRCDATRVDHATGTRPDAQPLKWLAQNRPPRDADRNAATFAINAVFPATSQARVIRVGDVVRVLREW